MLRTTRASKKERPIEVALPCLILWEMARSEQGRFPALTPRRRRLPDFSQLRLCRKHMIV